MEDKAYQLFSCQERIELSAKLGVTEQQVTINEEDKDIYEYDRNMVGDTHNDDIMTEQQVTKM